MIADPTYGYTEEQLFAVDSPPAPSDFAAFWQERYVAALTVDVRAEMVLSETARTDLDLDGLARDVYDLEFTSVGGVRLGGWLTVPSDGRIEHGLVVGHGYGGQHTPAPVPLPRAAALFFCSRGLPTRSLSPDLPSDAMEHVLVGIESRESYILGLCAADIWCAVTALAELVPQVAASIVYTGGSFGGGTGALAMPWDPRILAASLIVPSFGNHPLRATLRCEGSGEAVRLHLVDHPEALDVLEYFDAAIAASMAELPVQVIPALSDPVVPPPGQFAIYNALPEPRECVVIARGHQEYPGMELDGEHAFRAQQAFFSAILDVGKG